MSISNKLIFTIVALLVLNSCVHQLNTVKSDIIAPPEGYGTLDKLPFKESWFGMYFQEDKVGFSHYKIEPSGDNFVIHNESVMRLTANKKTNELKMKEQVTVRPDLSMVGFQSNVDMNGKVLKMNGNLQADLLMLQMEVDGEKINREYPIQEKVYHTSAISLMPALRGIKEGQTYSFGVFNPEKQDLEKIEQTITSVKGEPGPSGAVWKIKNNYGKSVVLSWTDKQGRTVLEKALDGQLVTILEDESTAKKFLEKKSSGKDAVLDISMVKVDQKIKNPLNVSYMKLKVGGIDPELIAENARQKKSPPDSNGTFLLSITKEDLTPFRKAQFRKKGAAAFEEYLEPTVNIPSNHKEIIDQSLKIVTDSDTPLNVVMKFANWTAKNISKKMQDSYTALSVLRTREGECQSHSNLYAAFARAHQIPTRVVIGLVYSDDGGFVYHAWAESYFHDWLSVDPTFGQVPADATHIRIAGEGTSDELSKIFKLIGKIKIDVLEYR